MEDYLTVTIDHIRPVTHTVHPTETWMTYGNEESGWTRFKLDNPEQDSLRLVERRPDGSWIICNQWRTPTMPAPAFWYFSAEITVSVGALPLRHEQAPFHVNYSRESGTAVVNGQRFKLEGISQAISQNISQPEKPTPGYPSPLGEAYALGYEEGLSDMGMTYDDDPDSPRSHAYDAGRTMRRVEAGWEKLTIEEVPADPDDRRPE